MSFFKKGSNWYIDYYVAGRRKREMIGPNKRLAQSVLAKRKLQIAENRFLDVRKMGRIRFEELADLYLDYSKTNKRSWTRDRTSIRALSQLLREKYLNDITPLLIENYKKKRLAEVKPATVNRELACLKHMFTKAVEWDKIEDNPIKKVKLLREDNERFRWLRKYEVQKLCDNCAEHLKPIVLMALHTGMRRGEILKLKWEDVDLDQGIVLVKHTKNNEIREIPLNNLLTNILKQIKIRSPYVFSRQDGKPYGTIRRSFESALKKAGIKNCCFHDLRHTFSSHLVMSGVDIMTVRELLGHKSLRMTMRYSHLSQSHKRSAIELLEYSDGHQDGHQRDIGEAKEKANSLI